MKHLLFTLLIGLSLAGKSQQCPPFFMGSTQLYVDSVGALKDYAANHKGFAYPFGKDSIRDGKGGVFMFDTASLAVHDGDNVVQPGYSSVCVRAKGRWLRVNVNRIPLPQGSLMQIAGEKRLSGTATMDASGEATINLTTDNTAGGTALFNNIAFVGLTAIRNSNLPNDIVVGDVKVIGTSNKTITVKFATGPAVLALLSPPTGTVFRFYIVGN